jgi:hypothetical protein
MYGRVDGPRAHPMQCSAARPLEDPRACKFVVTQTSKNSGKHTLDYE